MNILHACYYATLGKLINNLTVVGIPPLVYIEYITVLSTQGVIGLIPTVITQFFSLPGVKVIS